MKKLILALLLIITVVAALSWYGGTESSQAEVRHIKDGDTIVVETDGLEETVRFLNVDTPEYGTGDDIETCFAEEATQFLQSRLPVGAFVDLVLDKDERDQYGRLLAGVLVGDDLVNAEIAEAGLGEPVFFAPNDRFLDDVSRAWDSAEKNGRGQFDPAHHCYGR